MPFIKGKKLIHNSFLPCMSLSREFFHTYFLYSVIEKKWREHEKRRNCIISLGYAEIEGKTKRRECSH